MTGREETDVCEAAVAETNVIRGGITVAKGRRAMAVSMRATWSAGFVDTGAEE